MELTTDAGRRAIRRKRWGFAWGGRVTDVVACGAGKGGRACFEVLGGSVQWSKAYNL